MDEEEKPRSAPISHSPWQAELEVGPEVAARLVEEQFPELEPARAELVGAGWDNVAYRVNGRWIFRFPRRRVAVELIEVEGALLPWIAGSLPLAVPVPAFMGSPTEEYPWPFSGYAELPGRTACRADPGAEARGRAAPRLGAFLKALHGLDPAEAARRGAPEDNLARTDIPGRRSRALDRLERAAVLGLLPDISPFRDHLLEMESMDCFELRLVHGDLYSRHLLVDDHEDVTGVIDWGDVHRGHPAIDLAIAHLFLPPEHHPAFLAAYGPVDPSSWRLARFRAIYHSLNLLHYAHEIADAALERETRAALAFIAG